MRHNILSSIVTIARILLCAAVVFTLYEATMPNPFRSPVTDNSDKFLHALAFFTLAFLADMSFPSVKLFLRKLIFLLFFGIFIELVQVYLPWRSAEMMDLVADGAGMVLYFVPVSVVRRKLGF
jgi:VanZ family protein